MRGVARLTRQYRRLTDYVDPKAVILMYHRVAQLPGYAYDISVTPDRFRAQMAHLREAFQPVGLGDLARALRRGSIPRRAVAVTFDDGYADNCLQALPILEALQVPATVFVSSGSIDSEREYWWDDLERLLHGPQGAAERLEISIRGRAYHWTLADTEQRRTARREIHQLIKPLHPDDRENVLAALARWSGLGREGRAEHRSMTRGELRQLANSPLVEIGGHTVNHPQLAGLPYEAQRDEIVRDRRSLESITGKAVRAFSYPFGGAGDFSSDTVSAVQEAGLEYACSTLPARVTRGADPFRLPRFWVGDWGIDEFRAQLARFSRP